MMSRRRIDNTIPSAEVKHHGSAASLVAGPTGRYPGLPRPRLLWAARCWPKKPRIHGSEKLPGYDDRYRLRQGQFSFVYLIDDARREETIYKIEDRKSWMLLCT
jgi:hypothetical protein